MPSAHASRAGRGGQDQARPRGRRSPRRPLPARRPLRPARLVASPDFFAPALAESIQFAVDGAHSGFSAQEQLLDYLSERSTLLVLDNFEHLVEGSGLLGEVSSAPRTSSS